MINRNGGRRGHPASWRNMSTPCSVAPLQPRVHLRAATGGCLDRTLEQRQVTAVKQLNGYGCRSCTQPSKAEFVIVFGNVKTG